MEEADHVPAALEFGEANGLAGQALADELRLALPPDRAIATTRKTW